MRVLVVATRGADKSSTFYRWTQLAPIFERAGAEIEYLYKSEIGRARLRAVPPCDWVLNLRCPLNGVAARATARLGRLFAIVAFIVCIVRFFDLQGFAGFLVNDLHGEANLAAVVKAEQLDPDLVVLLDDVL